MLSPDKIMPANGPGANPAISTTFNPLRAMTPVLDGKCKGSDRIGKRSNVLFVVSQYHC